MSVWTQGIPTDPGCYLIRGLRRYGGKVGPVVLIGLMRVTCGPRGGYRCPRWVDPEVGRHVQRWHEDWQFRPVDTDD